MRRALQTTALLLATLMMVVHGPVLTPSDGALQAQSAAGIPRTPDGKPDFSGIWQAMNTAAWDIQDHAA